MSTVLSNSEPKIAVFLCCLINDTQQKSFPYVCAPLILPNIFLNPWQVLNDNNLDWIKKIDRCLKKLFPHCTCININIVFNKMQCYISFFPPKSLSKSFKVAEKAMSLAEPWDSGHPLTQMASASLFFFSSVLPSAGQRCQRWRMRRAVKERNMIGKLLTCIKAEVWDGLRWWWWWCWGQGGCQSRHI